MLISQQGNKAAQAVGTVGIEDLAGLSEDAGNSGGDGPATAMVAETGATMFALIVSVSFGYLLA